MIVIEELGIYYSQVSAAEILGCTRGAISHYLLGRRGMERLKGIKFGGVWLIHEDWLREFAENTGKSLNKRAFDENSSK